MKWVKKVPDAGDMLRIKKNGVFHYGIYVGNRRAVQFGTADNAAERDASRVRVALCPLDDFLREASFCVAECEEDEKTFPREETVRRAVSRIGEGGYDFVRNNCEHFVYECALGVHRAPETEKFSRLFTELPKTAVYIGPYPFSFPEQTESIFPLERRREIERAREGKTRREKYYVWKLLEYALRDYGNIDIRNLNLRRNEFGKWQSDGIFLSLSHAKEICAVGLSSHPVGVDIELFTAARFNERLARYILTPDETKRYDSMDKEQKERFCAAAWTGKESVFKREDTEAFAPRRLDGFSDVVTERVLYGDNEYFLSCASRFFRRVRFCPLAGVRMSPCDSVIRESAVNETDTK